MSEPESCRERQKNELEVLKAIFEQEIRFPKRNKSKKRWQPLEVTFSLTPQKSMTGPAEIYATVDFHVICSENYPEESPEIELLNSRGLSNQQTATLLKELNNIMASHKGEVVIFELCQHIQSFLRDNNRKIFNSCHDEMVHRLKKEKEDELERKKNEEIESLKIIEEEIKMHDAALKAEYESSRETKHSDNQLSIQTTASLPRERMRTCSKQRHESTTEYFEHSCDHSSKLITFVKHKKEQQIHCVRCVAHGKNNSVVYLGIDSAMSQMVAIKEWTLNWEKSSEEIKQSLMKHLTSIEQEINQLNKLSHPNLVPFLNMTYSQDNKNLTIHVLQEFVFSTTCSTFLKDQIPFNIDRIRKIATEVLKALHYLHINCVVHKDLRDSCIHMLTSGGIKLSDYSIDKKISDMFRINNSRDKHFQTSDDYFPSPEGRRGKKFDVYCFGLVLLSLIKGSVVTEQTVNLNYPMPSVFRDFLTKCLIRDERTRWSALQLMDHTFIRTPIGESIGLPQFNLDQQEIKETQKMNDDFTTNLSSMTGQSRLQSEFQVLEQLGKGAFGDVLKVKNKLDDSFYAIKRIKLNPQKKEMNRKITREVKLLSKLYHENVVRYYCSWIESTIIDSTLQSNKFFIGSELSHLSEYTDEEYLNHSPETENKTNSIQEIEWNISKISFKSKEAPIKEDSEEEYNSSDSESDEEYENNKVSKLESSFSIEFEHSKDVTNPETSSLSQAESDEKQDSKSKFKEIEFMYIQMEFCEKSTLRTAIDNGLYKDAERMWRLFREMVEGLAHIHHQGMIHRDLKPVNIFIDSNDHVKIGDFGLATTNILSTMGQLNVGVNEIKTNEKGTNLNLSEQRSMTGQVGTALYVAPELNTKAERPIYNQKVDIYSLGIILFEMSCEPLNTGMERVSVLLNLRKKEIVLLENMDEKSNVVHLLRWLLNHDPSQRPTAQELLTSGYLAQQEEAEFNERIRQTLSNQHNTKSYKHLIDCCFAQKELSFAEDYTYDHNSITVQNQSVLKNNHLFQKKLRSTIRKVFLEHGGRYIPTPLMMPKSVRFKRYPESSVQCMTRFGNVVFLPHDLRTPFARYIVWNNIHRVRRYVIDRVYRERKINKIHPRELYECAFDIISPEPENLLQEAEMIYIVWEICNKISYLKDRNFVVKLNHTFILEAIFSYCEVDKDKYEDIYKILCDVGNGKFSKLQAETHLSFLCLTDHAMDTLMILLDQECTVENVTTTILGLISRAKGDAISNVKEGLSCIKTVIKLTKELGTKWTMNIKPLMAQDFKQYSGIIYQISLESTRRHKRVGRDVIAAGGRYNKLLKSFSKGLSNCYDKINGVGISISLEKLVFAIQKSIPPTDIDFGNDGLDVMVCEETHTCGKEYLNLIKELWSLNLEVDCSQFKDIDEILEYCTENQIKYIVILRNDDQGSIMLYTREKERYQERKINLIELIDYMQQQIESSSSVLSRSDNKTSTNNETCTPFNASVSTNINFTFLDKLSFGARRNFKSTVIAQLMDSTLQMVINKIPIEIIVTPLDINVNKSIAIMLKLDEEDKDFEQSVEELIDMYPRLKKHIKEVCEEIRYKHYGKIRRIVVLYSCVDNLFTVKI